MLGSAPPVPPCAGTELVGSVRIDKIRPYFDRPGFRQPFADGTVEAVREALAAGLGLTDLEIVFTTHSIPLTMAATSGSAVLGDHRPGGAYVTQHLAVAQAVIDQVVRRLRQRTQLAAGLPIQVGAAVGAVARSRHQ